LLLEQGEVRARGESGVEDDHGLETILVACEAIDNFKQNVEKISDPLVAKGVRQILITPTIYDETFKSPVESLVGVNGALGECSDFVLDLEKKRNARVVDFWHPMNEINTKRQQLDPQFTLIGKDRIHPGPMGRIS
jgi:hypothetical protein